MGMLKGFVLAVAGLLLLALPAAAQTQAHGPDQELVTKLQDEGYPVARRTVTKYRKMLDIPSSRQRKDWTLVTP